MIDIKQPELRSLCRLCNQLLRTAVPLCVIIIALLAADHYLRRSFTLIRDDPPPDHMAAVVKRLGKHTSVLRAQFETILEEVILASENSDRNVVFNCNDACHDGKYYFGAVSGFLMAMISERHFYVGTSNRCPLTDVYDAGSYGWEPNYQIPEGVKIHKYIQPTRNEKAHAAELFTVERHIAEDDFGKNYTGDILLLEESVNWVAWLRQNRATLSRMPWLVAMEANDFIRMVHVGLFKVPRGVRLGLHSTIIEQVGNSKLLCYFGEQNTPTDMVINYIKQQNNKRKYKMFIYGQDLRALNDEYSKHDFIDVSKLSSESSEGCRPHTKDMIASEVARMCDVMLTTNSRAGVLGSILRSSSDGLFCVNRYGSIYPCLRTEITSSFWDNINLPVDVWYIVRKWNIQKNERGNYHLT